MADLTEGLIIEFLSPPIPLIPTNLDELVLKSFSYQIMTYCNFLHIAILDFSYNLKLVQ